MLFSKADLEIGSMEELVGFLPIFILIALLAPFLIAAYSLGFVMDQVGWLKDS